MTSKDLPAVHPDGTYALSLDEVLSFLLTLDGEPAWIIGAGDREFPIIQSRHSQAEFAYETIIHVLLNRGGEFHS